MAPIKIKLTKVRESDKPFHPNNIQPGEEREGLMYEAPKVDECFYLQYEGRISHFRTSPVVKIVDENIFETFNSIYQIERL